MEPEVHERLRRSGILPRVQRQVEPIRVLDDDRAVRIPLSGGRIKAELRRVEVQAAPRLKHRQP
jgi:hypothetical protein